MKNYGINLWLKPKTCISAKELQMEVKQYYENSVKLMCEVPSITVKHDNLNAESENRDLTSIITRTTSFLQGSYQLCRKKAAEILVWLFSDTDRVWNVEIPHSFACCLGYERLCNASRSDVTHVWWHIECMCRSQHSCSLHNIWWCFLPLANRSSVGQPLTLIQLSHDVWKDYVAFLILKLSVCYPMSPRVSFVPRDLVCLFCPVP